MELIILNDGMYHLVPLTKAMMEGLALIKNELKRTSVHITPSAIPCTATYEAASPVEVWSLWPRSSTCTESAGFEMDRYTYP